MAEEDCMIPWEDAFSKYKEVQFNQLPTMNLNQWLNMWGRLCYGSSGISDFPIWVQLLPELFFEVADRDGKLLYEIDIYVIHTEIIAGDYQMFIYNDCSLIIFRRWYSIKSRT